MEDKGETDEEKEKEDEDDGVPQVKSRDPHQTWPGGGDIYTLIYNIWQRRFCHFAPNNYIRPQKVLSQSSLMDPRGGL